MPSKVYEDIGLGIQGAGGGCVCVWGGAGGDAGGYGISSLEFSSVEFAFFWSQTHHSVAMCSSQSSDDLYHHDVVEGALSSDLDRAGLQSQLCYLEDLLARKT